jgi:hypothetical protein
MVQDLRWLRDMSINRRIYESETFPGHTKRAVKQWAKCLRNLFDGDPEALKVIGTVFEEALALLEERNAIVHSFWPYWHEDPERIVLHSVKPIKDKPDKLLIVKYEATVDELDDLNEKIRDLYHMVFKISGAALARAKRVEPISDKDEE